MATWLRLGPAEELDGRTGCTRPPVFVGGTGRSGTTVTGRIIGSHPSCHMIPYEVRFLTEKGGVCDLLRGRTSFTAFAWRTQHSWSRTMKGPRQLVPTPRMRAALRELRGGLKADRGAACARFVERLLDPIAIEAGAEGWVEMTPGNVHRTRALVAMWPDTRIVHSVRDGRDSACSVIRLPWGPNDRGTALRWWARQLESAFKECAATPAESVLVVQMEELLGTDRERQLARLLAFLDLAPTPEVTGYFNDKATADRASIRRWQTDVPEEERPAFDTLYRQLADSLVEQGFAYRELPPQEAPGNEAARQPD